MATRVMATTPTHLFTETIDTERPTYSTGTAGGKAPSYAPNLTGVPCAFQPQVGSEIDEYGRQHSRRSAQCFVGGGLDIRADDRVIFDGSSWSITAPPKDNQAAGVVVRLDLQEVTP